MNSQSNGDLPKGWQKCKLPDFCNLVMGQSPPSSTYNTQTTGLPFYQGKSEFRFIYPKPEKYCSVPNKIAEQGDILLSVRAPVGPTNIAPHKCCIGRGLSAIRPLGNIENKFVLFLFRSFEHDLSKEGTGTTFKAITKDFLVNLEASLPPLNEQHRIVSKLEELFSELDKGIESFKTARQQLKVYRQAVLKHAFEGKLTEEWRKQHADELESAETLLKKIKSERKQRYQQQLDDWEQAVKTWEAGSKEGKKPTRPNKPKELPPLTEAEFAKLSELPEGWRWGRAGFLFESVTSGSRGWAKYYSDNGAVFIRITNLNYDALNLDLSKDKIQYVDPPNNAEGLRTRVQEGDFLFSITGYLGMFAIAPKVDEAYVNQHIALARPLSGFSKQYLGYYITAKAGGHHHLNKLTKGAVKAGLGLDDIQTFPVPMCSQEEQKKIVEEIESRLSVVEKLEQDIEVGLRQAETLRQSLLKKAFEGKLVPQDPTDEPASVLLERIKAEKAEQEKKARPRNQKKNASKFSRKAVRKVSSPL